MKNTCIICQHKHEQLWAQATAGIVMPVAYPTSTRNVFKSLNGDGGTQV